MFIYDLFVYGSLNQNNNLCMLDLKDVEYEYHLTCTPQHQLLKSTKLNLDTLFIEHVHLPFIDGNYKMITIKDESVIDRISDQTLQSLQIENSIITLIEKSKIKHLSISNSTMNRIFVESNDITVVNSDIETIEFDNYNNRNEFITVTQSNIKEVKGNNIVINGNLNSRVQAKSLLMKTKSSNLTIETDTTISNDDIDSSLIINTLNEITITITKMPCSNTIHINPLDFIKPNIIIKEAPECSKTILLDSSIPFSSVTMASS